MSRPRRSLALAIVAASCLTAGCTQVRDHQGYLFDPVLLASVEPGIDNRDSVSGTLGRPTFVGQFNDRDWYYVSRNTENLGFEMPDPVSQTVLHIRFDEAGNVVTAERTGMEQVVSINPSRDETPTLGRDRGFFQELFGNIGAVGAAGQAAPTADNPNG